MKKVAVIDYGMGNLDSVAHAIEACGETATVTSRAEDIKRADFIILPGVGSFSEAMCNLRNLGLDSLIKEKVLKDCTPILGICLGMQLLATKGYEGGPSMGLDIISGEVKKFEPTSPDIKIPHIGWNEVVFNKQSSLFNDIQSGKDFYFVHSYHFVCDADDDILARTLYCQNFVSAISRANIFGVQFHPEKSSKTGLKLLSNFLSI